MKYKITLGGYGADFYVHKLTQEQKEKLSEAKVDNPALSDMVDEQICEVLNIENVDETDLVKTGVYDETSTMHIEVFDENNNKIFDSLDEGGEWYFDTDLMDEYDNYESLYEDEDGPFFFVEGYCKGPFFEFNLECEEFNPKLLTPERTEINDRWDLITGLYYNGEKIEDMEFGDYWGKGYYYHLS